MTSQLSCALCYGLFLKVLQVSQVCFLQLWLAGGASEYFLEGAL